LNDLDAEWCMQCSRRLVPARKKVDMNEGAVSAGEIVAGSLDLVAGDAHEGSDEGIADAFVVTDSGVTWTCGRCGHLNEIKASACVGCGMTFVDSARKIASEQIPGKQSRSIMKALGIVAGGAVVMRLVAGLISPWAAAGVLGAAAVRTLVKYLRA
jgi:hypothetical protein